MNKERTKVGDIRISKRTKKPIICTGVEYTATGNEDSTWTSYEKNLLRTRMGMSPESHQLHPLQHFVDALDANQPIKQKDTIKIRYAYIVRGNTYYDTLRFKVVSLAELEIRPNRIDFGELITDGKGSLIEILGRDLYTGRVDMEGKDIYTRDIIRWYIEDRKQVYDDETVDVYTHFYEQDLTSKRDCKVIGTIYDKERI